MHALQLASGAQRDEGLDGLVLLGVTQLAANALAQVDDAVARAAGDAFGGVQRHLHGRATVRAVELAGFLVAGGFILEPLELQVVQQHGAALRHGLGGRLCARRAVFDAEHLAVGAAQLDHREGCTQRWQLRQLALGRYQGDLLVEGNAVGLAIDGGGDTHAELRRVGHGTLQRQRAGEDVGAVVFGQAGHAAVIEDGVPLGPHAVG